jgi:superfamily II DNA or RNA helicase
MTDDWGEDVVVPSKPAFKLRGRQPEWMAAILADLKLRSRILVVAPGGVGKTTLFAALAAEMWKRGIRTLVLENRDRLTEQTAERIRKETGLDVDVEKADQHASPYAPIVVACVQSLSKVSRLTGFADTHFGLLVADECHLALSPSWLRIIHFFHHGADSLTEGWVAPKDGDYKPKCSVVGFTASPDLGDRRNLGELFHHQSVNYSYLTAIEEGWLVGIREVNIPIHVDTRKFRIKKSAEGNSFSVEDQNTAYTPEVIEKLAAQYVEHASDRKGIIFVPSVEIARQLAVAIGALGLLAIFVSGECIDKNEKTDVFAAAGKGSVLINCCLYTYGIDFPDVNCVAPFGAIISKVKYIQSIYRGTRVLDGVVRDSMTAEERVAAIAASKKPHLLVLSPFFISDRIKICEPFDLFGVRPEGAKKKRAAPDFTKPGEIRDYITALENEVDKHRTKQPRTINPVALAVSLKIMHYEPLTDADAAKPSRDELDILLAHEVDTSVIKSSGEAQILIGTLRERERLGLATPKQLNFLKVLGIPAEQAVLMKKGMAGAIIGSRKRR